MRHAALAAAVALASLHAATPASAASVRYAAPGGTGVACTQVAPCSLQQAVTGAADGDTVQLSADEYLLTAPLNVTADNLTIAGPERIYSSGDFRAFILFSGIPNTTSKITANGTGTRFQDLSISGTASGSAHLVKADSATFDRVYLQNDGDSDTLRGLNSTLRNSVVKQTGTGNAGSAVTISGSIVGSTIYSANGNALLARNGGYWSNPACSLTIRNTIAWGGGANLQVDDTGGGCTPAVDYDHSWIPTGATGGGILINGVTLPVAGPYNLPSTPVLFNPTDPTSTYLSDLVLPPDSPAINAGCTTGCSEHDYYGRPRPIGSANDIGAMEQSLAPETMTLDVTGISRTGATFSSAINPLGSPAAYTFRYRKSGTTNWTTADSGTISSQLFGFNTVSTTVEGLSPGSRYEAQLVASNERGPAVIPDAIFRTSGSPASLVVGSMRAAVSKSKARIVSKASVSTGGTITQKATIGSKTRCTTRREVSTGGTYTLKCQLTKKTRKELQRKTLRFKVVTTLQTSGGERVSATARLKVRRGG